MDHGSKAFITTFVALGILAIGVIYYGTHRPPEKKGVDCIDEKGWKSVGNITNVQFTSPAHGQYIHDYGKTIITTKQTTVVLNSIKPVSIGPEAFMTTDCLGGSWFGAKGSNKSYLVYDKSN